MVNSVGGNIGTILGARLASGLHIGTITYSFKDKIMHQNLFTSLTIGIITFFVLAILIYYIGYFGDIQMGLRFPEYLTIIMITGIVLVIMISFISITTAFISFKILR